MATTTSPVSAESAPSSATKKLCQSAESEIFGPPAEDAR